MSQKIVAVYRGQKNSFLSSEYGYDRVRVEQASDKKSFFRILKKLLPSRNLAAIWFTDFCSLSEA